MSDAPKRPLAEREIIHRRMRMMNDLFVFAQSVKKHQLRKKYPELSERELTQMAYALIERGCS